MTATVHTWEVTAPAIDDEHVVHAVKAERCSNDGGNLVLTTGGETVATFRHWVSAVLVSHLAPAVERIKAEAAAEFQWNALEMARKADLAERRAEEAEFHVEQLRDARDSAERRIERTERLIDSWERDAPDHSNPVFIGRLRETLQRDPAPVRLRGEECEHHWLDRPESDTRECLICGTEVAG